MKDISTVNSKFILNIGAAVYTIDHFSPESDMWTVDDIESGALELTPDGKPVKHSKQAFYNAHLTLSGASEAAEVLRQLAALQVRQGNRLAVCPEISVIIENNGNIEKFSQGVLQGGGAGYSYGNEKLGDQTFNFQFANRDFIGGIGITL